MVISTKEDLDIFISTIKRELSRKRTISDALKVVERKLIQSRKRINDKENEAS